MLLPMDGMPVYYGSFSSNMNLVRPFPLQFVSLTNHNISAHRWIHFSYCKRHIESFSNWFPYNFIDIFWILDSKLWTWRTHSVLSISSRTPSLTTHLYLHFDINQWNYFLTRKKCRIAPCPRRRNKPTRMCFGIATILQPFFPVRTRHYFGLYGH